MKAKTAVAPGVEYLHAGTFSQPGEIFRVNDTFGPRLSYSPVAIARMFEAAPAMLEALEVVKATMPLGTPGAASVMDVVLAAIREARGEVVRP